MKLSVKTLKGEKFEVEVEDDASVAQVKGVIEATKSEIPAASTKLIHSGKVLKDDDTIGKCGIKPKDFLVVMVTKPKKVSPAAAAAPAAESKATETSAKPTSTEGAKTPAAGKSQAESSAAAPATTTTPAPTATQTTSPPPAPAAPDYSAAASGLVAMGFPEAEVQHCLRVAQGNPDLAVEFLTNGIPEGLSATGMATGMTNATASTPGATTSSSMSSSSGGEPLAALRQHPQLNDLRRLVQSNPQMLQQVLSQIGQQQPELLAQINQNQALFLQMMNEPVSTSSSSSTGAGGENVSRSSIGLDDDALAASANPAQMAGIIQSMSDPEVAQMAAMMGLSPEQLRQTAQMMGSLPPEQLQQFMASMGGGDLLGGGGGDRGGTVINLTPDEMAAVDRLAELGFDRTEAAQAFLACDKNEALAANLLMDSMNDIGNSFGGGGGGDDDDNNDDDDNMYD